MRYQNHECVGLYEGKKLIGICSLWFILDIHIGKTAEVDHVVIDENFSNLGLGKKYLIFLYQFKTKKL